MWPLPIGDLFGCGSKTAEKLIRVGIRTIGEASHTDPHFLRGLLGDAAGTYIYQAANGKSDSPVSDEARDVKSVSNEYTTREDITEKNWKTDGLKMLDYLTTKVSGRLAKQGLYAETIGVSVKTDDFKRHSIQTPNVRILCRARRKSILLQGGSLRKFFAAKTACFRKENQFASLLLWHPVFPMVPISK